MTVFTTVVAVALSAAATMTTNGIWLYPVDQPVPPTTTKSKRLVNPTVSQIQAAISSRTRVDVVGNVSASGGQRLTIDDNDVRLNFERASVINWSGGDTWAGFLEINSHRVEVNGLRMQVTSSGKCRGVVIHSPATDVRIKNCEFSKISDGLIADGKWRRLSVENTSFTDCSDWPSGNMDGGYGIFLEDDDNEPDHFRLINVDIRLASSSGQHGLRISNVQDVLIDRSFISANNKRSFWAYGVERLTARRSTFDKGSVLFSLKPFESMTQKPVSGIRLDACEIKHRSILTPLAVYCGKGATNIFIRDLDITSTTSNRALEVSWRSNNDSRKICWYDGSLTFNGQTMYGMQYCQANDWSSNDRQNLSIGPVPDPRNN